VNVLLLLAALSFCVPMRVANTKAPGAPALLRAVKLELPVLGIFQPSTSKIINHFVMGEFGVNGHQLALPARYDRGDVGGYTVLMQKDGEAEIRRSGSLEAPITGVVERSIKRYFGLVPEGETLTQKLKRRILDLADALAQL
jgi:hypothetical protein